MKQRLLFLSLTLAGFMLGAAVSVMSPAGAQGAPPATAPATAPLPGQQPAHPHAPFMRALHSLNLSDSQKTQIMQIVQQTHQANANADPQTRKTNMQSARSQIMQLLTPDQRAQLETTLQQMQQQSPQGQPPQGQQQQS